MPDMTHVIMEQAMKYGRTLTIKAADAMVTGPAGKAMPQMVHLELRPTDGGPGKISIIPTHATTGRQLEDQDWIHFIKQMAGELDKAQ